MCAICAHELGQAGSRPPRAGRDVRRKAQCEEGWEVSDDFSGFRPGEVPTAWTPKGHTTMIRSHRDGLLNTPPGHLSWASCCAL